MRTFSDRADAGRALAASPEVGALGPDTLVLALPRGGVLVAAEVARALGASLDVLVVRKIGAPGNPEYAIGAVDRDGQTVGDLERFASAPYVKAQVEAERVEIARREEVYRRGRRPLSVSGRTVLLVDDGIATGLTALAAVGWLRRNGAQRIVVAVPVASPSAVGALERAGAQVVVLEEPFDFMAVGQAYRRFEQNTDAEVLEALATR
jgi:putative phosphoribosyl transferase